MRCNGPPSRYNTGMDTSRTLPSVRPLVPQDVSYVHALPRAAWASVAAQVGLSNAEAVLAKAYPNDPVAAAIVARSAIGGAISTSPAWAGTLIGRATAEFLRSLPRSAASRLIEAGVKVVLAGVGIVNVPILSAPLVATPWIPESGAIPLSAFSFGTTPLQGKKLGVIVCLSNELARYSGAEQIFNSLLLETAALSLDAAYFATSAGSTSAHEGLLNGITPLAGSDDMMADLRALAAAVSGPGSSGQVTFITAPGRAAAALLDATVRATLLPSPALPADRVIAVDPLSLIHGHDGSPDISASIDATLNMSDTPTDIGTPGTPNLIAAPVMNMFQVGMISMRLLVDIAFAKRRADCVQYADGCSW